MAGQAGTQVRYKAPENPLWARMVGGGIKGALGQVALKQAREQEKENELLRILPSLASMRQLQPAQPGEEGAFQVGDQWFKIQAAPETEQDKLARERRITLEDKRTPAGRRAAAKLDWEENNAIIPEGEKKQKMRKTFYDQVDQLYPMDGSITEDVQGGGNVDGQPQTHYSLSEWNNEKNKARYNVLRQDDKGVVVEEKPDVPGAPWMTGLAGAAGIYAGKKGLEAGGKALANQGLKSLAAGGAEKYGEAVFGNIARQYGLKGAQLGLKGLGLTRFAPGLAGMASGVSGMAAPLLAHPFATGAAALGGSYVGNKLYDESSRLGQYGGFNPIGQGGGLEQAIANMYLLGNKGARQELNQGYDAGQYNQPLGQ